MNTFTIRHSTETDIPRIMEIYAYARQFMAEHGNPDQWGPTNWPPEELIRNIVRNRTIYENYTDEERFFAVHIQERGS